MLGGSIGIAMSSAVLASQQRAQLAGIVSASALQELDFTKLSNDQMTAIRKTYNDSFTQTMRVSAIVAGIGVLLTMGTFSRDRLPLNQHRDRQVREEIARRQAVLAEKQITSSDSSDRSA